MHAATRLPHETSPRTMPLVPALEIFRDWRRDEIVVTTMGTAREWPKLSQHPLDFHYIPSAMGHAPVLGLGLALAQPQREVIAFNGDGGTLMSLGCLVTIAAAGAANLTLIVLDNGIYEVTGGQRTAAPQVDFASLARAAGFQSVATFDSLEAWRGGIASALTAPGPRFVVLRVAPVGDDYLLESPGPITERLARFRAALAT
ncbi:MAG: hypothetical protein KF708_11090 [Pirellulales bacterium]|nr:hypothetical protein [Pirellulales bacterium]